jgi:hypothetical protein
MKKHLFKDWEKKWKKYFTMYFNLHERHVINSREYSIQIK